MHHLIDLAPVISGTLNLAAALIRVIADRPRPLYEPETLESHDCPGTQPAGCRFEPHHFPQESRLR